MKKYFNLSTLLIFGVIIIMIVSLIMVFVVRKRSTAGGVEIVASRTKQDEEITEEEARKVAVKQFKILGEKVKAEDLKVIKIKRMEVEYYYITSRENTLEIKILGGQIERINNTLIE